MKLTIQQQANVVRHIQETFQDYENRLRVWHAEMIDVYEKTRSFKQPKKNKRDTSFKVNKAHEIENKVMPKILANDPKWIVSYQNEDMLNKDDLEIANMSTAVRDYLHYVFKQQDVKEWTRLRGRNWIRYWLWFAKVDYKYAINRTKSKKDITELDENGEEITMTKKVIDEDVGSEYPCINVIPVTDMYFDPRYLRFEDMPAVIEFKRRVRLSSLTQNKKKYMNIDNVIEAGRISQEDPNWLRNFILAVTGIWSEQASVIDTNTLDIKCFYWLYDISDSKDCSNEKLYEFWTLNDTFLIYADEISSIPFEDFRCFEDTDTFLATGIIQPILGLQDEMNFKKNATATYINQSLYRSWFWTPNSGVNPKDLNNAHWNIIPTSSTREQTENGLREVAHRQLPWEVFNEQNDFERQIQALSYTIDTGNPTSAQALTNTATGAKIKAFESNAVMWEIRKHLEEALARLAYKLLLVTLDELDENIVIKKLDWEWFWQINKEAFRDAITKYTIEVESGSSSYDSEEKRREDAISRRNLAMQAKQAGLSVNLKKTYENIMMTYEKSLPADLFEQEMPQMPIWPEQVAIKGSMQNPLPPQTWWSLPY